MTVVADAACPARVPAAGAPAPYERTPDLRRRHLAASNTRAACVEASRLLRIKLELRDSLRFTCADAIFQT